jgi:hypothetical protein
MKRYLKSNIDQLKQNGKPYITKDKTYHITGIAGGGRYCFKDDEGKLSWVVLSQCEYFELFNEV